jgi:predicted RNA-binding Zn ribbon-like protein
VLTPDGVEYEVVAANAWRVPWTCAAELVELLDQRGDRIRGCANPDCVLWFLDTTRPGTRRWCSMAACGNRDKAIRHGRLRRP